LHFQWTINAYIYVFIDITLLKTGVCARSMLLSILQYHSKAFIVIQFFDDINYFISCIGDNKNITTLSVLIV